ncbi:redoxin family protein [Marvinbryantia formatexigens DSM 14469]|uniref:Redoxin family protein n=1 Tax=Marvinbryantia formatexigens DSM 14469 TaxID=478749 RepID=C6LJP8_9FIRM|nr:TlpA disulfide reductase family protein [Marvinbryantia formatexigens]EET59171.1 redoxin family protein [Marvinbryantia formatexigens DSM 14469]UWO26219.1 TlpA family protein disulfide reductase [Marvinbryantia formatexigens DSM 14469]SDG12230.1 Thiol-disulfide isomerase or thioredoxin [Marvinbryantia formatexigens]
MLKKKIAAILSCTVALSAFSGLSAGAMLWDSDKLPTEVPSFTTEDIAGNEVTEDIFSDKDVTMVNVWGTFCSPCISEMPELGEIARSLPENMQMVGLVIDVMDQNNEISQTNLDLANQIVEKADAGFTQLIANEDFAEFLSPVTGVPSTFFVDKDGNILGQWIEGADVDAYKERLEEYQAEYPADSTDADTEASAKVTGTGAESETGADAAEKQNA